MTAPELTEIATSAPIALFAYNRPDHLQQTITALRANPEAARSELYVFSDAPRKEADAAGVAAVRALVAKVSGFQSVSVVEAPENLGLAASIIGGVSKVLEKHDRIIVMEDDMITSPHFLDYMNSALEKYAADDRVISIHGYIYPTEASLPEAFFLAGADCWGWATWKRGWDLFNADGKALLAELERRKLTRAFDFDGTYPYTAMLRDQVNGKNQSWAVRWYASAFLLDKLTLYPGRSMVTNIGNDGSGSHCDDTTSYDNAVSPTPICLDEVTVAPSEAGREAFKQFFKRANPPRWKRVARRLRQIGRGGDR